ncbi:MAG: hypothetical protein JSR17_04915 [Proteobacteria bacterium]|nr:hypothetical protein [Pseudomonadota bacterium]
MPILSLEELDEILKQYAKEESIIYPDFTDENNRAICTISPYTIDVNNHPLAAVNEFGQAASHFIAHCKEYYAQGDFSPPLTEAKVQTIYGLLFPLNTDLCGAHDGNAFEKKRAKEWDTYWSKVIHELNNEGQQIKLEELTKVQQDLLAAYRFKIILRCSFKENSMDDIRIQEFLESVNSCMANFSPKDAFVYLYQKFTNDFEMDMGLDLQTLSRHLSTNQRVEYLKKFEEILARKSLLFVGNTALTRLFEEITKDKEFLKQLPLLLENQSALGEFIRTFPDNHKRNALLSASIYEIFNSQNKRKKPKLSTLRKKQVQLLQSIMQDNQTNRGKLT